MPYTGSFKEYQTKGGSISYTFNVDEYFDYTLNIQKVMNGNYGRAQVWIDSDFIGEINCLRAIDISIPAEQEFYLPLLSKGQHTFTLKFKKEAKIGIGKISLIKIPIKIKEFLISQSFPGFMGKKGKDMYPLGNKSIIWKKAEVLDKGIVRLDAQLKPKEDCHAYAATEIICDKELQTTLRIGHNDAAFIWLNGDLIYEYTDVNAFKYNEFSVPIQLNKGVNKLALMIMQAGGSWLYNVNLDTYQFISKLPD